MGINILWLIPIEINGDNPHYSPLIFIRINQRILIPINPHCPLIKQILLFWMAICIAEGEYTKDRCSLSIMWQWVGVMMCILISDEYTKETFSLYLWWHTVEPLESWGPLLSNNSQKNSVRKLLLVENRKISCSAVS